jgi:hypothetical protein
MTTVFVAGSRAISKLNDQIRERLDNIMRQQLSVLVGDANGADRAIQTYLAKCAYGNVTVYSMEVCRNNVGDWPIRHHFAAPAAKHDRRYYGIKDLAMTKDATWGFMLWDGDSKGTLTNVVNLLNTKKKTLLYLATQGSFFNINTFEDLYGVLQGSGIENVPLFLDTLGLGDPGVHPIVRCGLDPVPESLCTYSEDPGPSP